MNSPGRGDRSASPTGTRVSVAESGLSTSRVPTRYGTGAMADTRAVPFAPSIIVGHLVHLCSDVNTGGAPRNTSPTADAARHAELIVPGAQFVGQPMPIARCARLANTAPAVNVGEVELETRRPVLPALGVFPGEITDVFGAGTKTRGAHHCAVAARQAAAGHLVPLRGLARADEQVPQIALRHLAAHSMGSGLDIGTRGIDFVTVSVTMRDTREHIGALRTAHVDKVRGCVAREAFREGQVVTRAGRGSGAHRCAEAEPARFRAVHRDHERLSTAGDEGPVGI